MHTVRHSGSQRIWKGWVAAGAVGLLFGLFGGCTVKKPQVPSMELPISIPVADDMTTIQEVAGDRSDFLRIGADDLMTLDFSTDFDRREVVGDRLRVTPTANTFSTELGDISLPGAELPDISLSLDDLVGQVLPEGTVPIIPATGIDQQLEVPLEEMQSLVIKEGGLDVEVANGLPMPLENLKLSLVDLGNGGVLVDELDLGDIEANGGAAQGAFSLDNKDISGSLAISVTGGTAEVTDVEVAGDPSVDISVVMRDMVVTSATAIIPQQEFSDRQVLEFPDDRIQVVRANISEGGLTLRVRNDIPLLMELELSLDELKKPDGKINTFKIDRLSPDEVREVVFDLDGNEFAPDDPLKLRLSYSARTVASGEPVTISSGGEIVVEALTEDLVFSRVEGVLNRIELTVDPVEEEVEFPEGLDNVALGQTALSVHLTSAVGFRSRIELDIEGTNNAGESASIHISEIFERGNPDNPISIVIAPDSEELTAFLNLLPSTVIVKPTVLLGDGAGTEVIEPSHWVQIDRVQFVAPAVFQIKGDTQIEPDPEFREWNDDSARERIERNLVSAQVITHIENHLPLGVKVSLVVATREEDVYTNPILRIPKEGAFEVPAATVDGAGRVSESSMSSRTIGLEAEDVLVFLQKGGVWTGVLVELAGTNGEVQLYGSDYVNVQAGTEVIVELNEDLVD